MPSWIVETLRIDAQAPTTRGRALAAGVAIPRWMPFAAVLWHMPDLVIKWLDVRDRWHRQRS